MRRYIHYFDTLNELNQARKNNYSEPWLSYTEESGGVDYNKTQKEKLTEQPLTFSILSDGTISLVDNEGSTISDGYHKTLKYKINDGQWTEYSSINGIVVSSGDTVQVKGTNFCLSDGSEESCNNFAFHGASPYEGHVDISGNIMSLVDEDDFSTLTSFPATPEDDETHSYYYSFNIFTRLNPVDAGGLILPATALSISSGYMLMFCDCSFLTKAPELPAIILSNDSYNCMFMNCTSLTKAPELPATTLGESCYMYMFMNCTSLTKAPELPATALSNSCYYGMFWGCTSLLEPPELPATTMREECYFVMFADCTGMTSAPKLPATTLSRGCYSGMLSGCTFTSAIELPATTLANNCYTYMFNGCTNLTEAPELPATSLTQSCYLGMFCGCTSLRTAPELPATTLSRACYSEMFSGCTNLNYIKCMAITKQDTTSLYSWVSGVSSNGTFVKNQSASPGFWSTGDSGIPNNWTIQTA